MFQKLQRENIADSARQAGRWDCPRNVRASMQTRRTSVFIEILVDNLTSCTALESLIVVRRFSLKFGARARDFELNRDFSIVAARSASQ